MGERGVGVADCPRTIAGRWLVATVLGRWELRDRLVAQLAEGPLRGGELAVVREAAKQALRGYFGDDYDVRSVTSFAASLHDTWHLPLGSGVMELEAVMRAALGELDVDVAGITASVTLEACFFSVRQIACEREWDERTLGQLVSRAEGIAFEQGWKPQLATS